MATSSNPREVIGGNTAVDHAKLTTDRLAKDYAEIERSVSDALEEARALPKTCESDDDQSRMAAVIKRLRDLHGRIEGIREMEKEPFLRSGTAVDSFFGRMKEKLFRKNKTDNAGAADVLQTRVNAYINKKADEERRRREEEARIAREAEEKTRREREAAERAQREAEERAARARKAENVASAEAAAREAADAAARLRDQEDREREERQQKTADASAKTADLVRSRTDEGHMVTARQVPFVEITDAMKLDSAALWPFVKDDHKLAALKAWAKTTQYRKAMAGAVIEMRNEAVIR